MILIRRQERETLTDSVSSEGRELEIRGTGRIGDICFRFNHDASSSSILFVVSLVICVLLAFSGFIADMYASDVLARESVVARSATRAAHRAKTTRISF